MAKKKAAKKAPAKKSKRTKAVKKAPKAARTKKASKAAGKKTTAGRRKKAAKKSARQTGVKILLHKKSGEWVELLGVKQITAKAPDSYGAPWVVVDSRDVDHPSWPDVDRRVELGTREAE